MAENLGGNRFRVAKENVKSFRILLAPAMGDIRKPFTVEFADGGAKTLSATPRKGDGDYCAELVLE